jgi:hypothetical protein
MTCPFCGLDPYEYVDVGIGSIPVAVTCCEDGHRLLVENERFEDLAQPWMEHARKTMELYEDALRKIAWNRDNLDTAGLVGIADEALNGPPITVEDDDDCDF